VPAVESVVREWRLRYDSAALGIPAHITLLVPFVPPQEIDEVGPALRELFAAQPAFSFSLARVARWPGIAWLAPEPAEPFRRLTELIFERHPAYPPYEGAHDEVVPHLTVALGDDSVQDEVEAALTPHLPIEAEAREVTLLAEDESGRWQIGERFPLRL
jgi:2'-5' RNA ligase